jgi:hypothetical protein
LGYGEGDRETNKESTVSFRADIDWRRPLTLGPRDKGGDLDAVHDKWVQRASKMLGAKAALSDCTGNDVNDKVR